MEWEVVIGLETHTQLQTQTKIFSVHLLNTAQNLIRKLAR